MSDTAKHGVPVRFQLLPGGTRPADVVNLAEVLTTLIEPHLTDEERSRREGLEWVDDYDWGYPLSSEVTDATTATDPGVIHEESIPASLPGAVPAGIPASESSSDAEETASPLPETQRSFPQPTSPSESRVKNILVPISPQADPDEAKRQLVRRLKGPLPAKTSLIMQTSGSTTGTGHLVALSAASLVASARSTVAAVGRPGRWILALPVEHIAGLQVLTRSLISGTKPVIVDTSAGFDPSSLVRAVERATADPKVPAYISLVPTQVSKILDAGGEPVQALAKVATILVGGSAVTPFLADRAKAAGWHVVETYGMTETCGGCVYDGVPLLGMQVSTVGEQIWISGTTLMEDYLEKPLASSDPDGPWVQMGPRRWFKTSDTGRMEGPRLIIQGRTDDVVNTGGVKVHASAVEESALSVGGVGEVSVVGLPDARWGELVTAVVVPSPDIDVDLLAPLMGSPASLGVRDGKGGVAEPDSLAARIRTAVTAELGSAHAPRVIVVVQHLPLLTNGKVDRTEVAEIAKRELRSGRAWVR